MNVSMSELKSNLARLAHLNDAALWQMARATVPPQLRSRMESLHHQLRRGEIAETDQKEIDRLEKLYRDTIVIRAQAALILQERGYDISNPEQFAPLI